MPGRACAWPPTPPSIPCARPWAARPWTVASVPLPPRPRCMAWPCCCSTARSPSAPARTAKPWSPRSSARSRFIAIRMGTSRPHPEEAPSAVSKGEAVPRPAPKRLPAGRSCSKPADGLFSNAPDSLHMTQTRFDVLTIGNAIVDIIAPVEPGFIAREGMQEGIMHLIDTDRAEDLYAKMPLSRQQISGGSAANTAAGVASLGGRAAFVGKVADDPLGDVFEADLTDIGVHYATSRLKNGALTARSMIFLSEDGERTMNTYLGACHELTERDIKPEEIGAAAVTYMEGFLWDPVEAKKAFVLAAHYAHKHERAAAFTLSDP